MFMMKAEGFTDKNNITAIIIAKIYLQNMKGKDPFKQWKL